MTADTVGDAETLAATVDSAEEGAEDSEAEEGDGDSEEADSAMAGAEDAIHGDREVEEDAADAEGIPEHSRTGTGSTTSPPTATRPTGATRTCSPSARISSTPLPHTTADRPKRRRGSAPRTRSP